ncbi:MAG: outer membrane lipoprotein-sorting protein [Bacteroidetes bacterium]|nr:outer membrane lipoprotein-sorting protein [Bacteroidota bacterium]
MSFKKNLMYMFSVVYLATMFLSAQTPEEKGLEIAIDADERDKGFGDSSSELTMILRNKQGDESTRQMSNKTLEVENDGDKSLVIFNVPRDVKGTAFLSFTHKSGPDDQWLYLPALKRVKRISSDNKSGPFMGSEFAYEDISSHEIEKYTYKYVKDENLDGVDCFVIERYPVDENSGYTKQVVWIDTDQYRSMKVVYYDRKNSLFKTLTYHEYNQYLNKYWRANKMSMINHQTGKSTDLLFNDYKFANGFSESDFNQNSLKRAR